MKKFVPHMPVVYWLYIGIVLVLAMVVIGGLTRLTNSGLSMVHWSFVGSLPPTSEAEWQGEFEKYQQSPEYKEVHSHFELQEFKSIYWWEYIHRFFGRLIGVVFLVPFAFFLFRGMIPRALIPAFLMILGLGAFQALLGWYMVSSGLIDVPRVSHYRLAAHLVTAFITCTFIYWVALKYQHHGRESKSVHAGRSMIVIFGGALLLQIIYGAFVAGLRSGWIHNTWPLMDGSLIAPAVWAMEPWFLNFIEGRSGIQFVHRTLGIILLLLSFLLYFKSRRWPADLRKSAGYLVIAVLLQFVLGVFTLVLQVPMALGVMHQVVALIVLLSWIRLFYSATYKVAYSN